MFVYICIYLYVLVYICLYLYIWIKDAFGHVLDDDRSPGRGGLDGVGYYKVLQGVGYYKV